MGIVARARHLVESAAALAACARTIERRRTSVGPKLAVAAARERGRAAGSRDDVARQDLRRLIRLVDRMAPGGPNCFRRVLLEIAVDPDAAAAPVGMGFRVSGPGKGHAWIGTGVEMDEPGFQPYDAIISL
jgi:hypothetical protein